MKHKLATAQRMVIKVGSSLLVDHQTGLRRRWLQGLLNDVAHYHNQGIEIVIVSSGAIALGRKPFGRRPQHLQECQAAAAIGQIQLAQAYQTGLSNYEINIAQLLLTLQDTESRQRYLNARNTIDVLLQHRIIPIINENDTVATSEIRYGDNDRLAARVAQMMNADVLVLLSDIDGLYTADPRTDACAQLIPEVTHIDSTIEAMAGDSATDYGSGGMRTKIAAAKIMLSAGGKMVIVKGDTAEPLRQLDGGAKATWFLPSTTPSQARKNWLRQHLNPAGEIIIDDGAAKALSQGSSLLAVGITAVKGEFAKGACVIITSAQGKILACGLSNYAASELGKIVGVHSSQISSILGYAGNDEVIHRDNLALTA